MRSIAKVKEALKAFYGRFDVVIDTLVKFVVAYVALRLMADRLGYFELLTNRYIMPMVALVCSILPWGIEAAILGVCLLLHAYKASLVVAIVLAFILIVVTLLYYGFQPGDAQVLVLVPVLFALKIPYAVPLIVGLSGSIMSIVPIGFGIIIYYLMIYVNSHVGVELGKISLTAIPDKLIKIIDGMLTNEVMWKTIVIFALAVLIVYFVHNLSFNYSWYVAVALGAAVFIVLGKVLKVDVELKYVIYSFLISAVYIFLALSVDYSKTERLQFEDDDYYYYVKAIPKLSVEYFSGVPKKNKKDDKGKTQTVKQAQAANSAVKKEAKPESAISKFSKKIIEAKNDKPLEKKESN